MMFFLLDSKGKKVWGCFRFEGDKCLDSGVVFDECFKCLRV